MGTRADAVPRAPVGIPAGVVALDVCAKVLLVLAPTRAMDPAWGNLEGKSPGTRALTYPLLAFAGARPDAPPSRTGGRWG